PIRAASELVVEATYGFDVVVGASTAGKLWEEGVERLRSAALRRSCDCARRVYVTTDDGSLGVHGFVTDAIEPLIHEREYEQVWACGPDPMMRSVAQQAHDAHTDCMVSLERTMGCGFGVCAGCNVELAQGGYALCCSDGPVFNARELAW
ncbi:MAG: dihydroorotate dehydrogenase electron transfer subunit, partial [Atopobiaceae bacterium]|nr:dihydroorotate dehydrogenase electron transfer subunit [Atopobiaceae bacterium]